MPRTILVHLNIEVPDDAPCTADDVAREVEGALEVGTDVEGGETPALAVATIAIPLAEEI